MKAFLVTPPHYYLGNTLAIPRLTAYLRHKGFEVAQIDVDTEIYDHFLSSAVLNESLDRISERTVPLFASMPSEGDRTRRIWSAIIQTPGRWGQYKNIHEIIEDREGIIDDIKENFALLQRDYMRLSSKEFQFRYENLRASMLLFSLGYPGVEWSLAEGISFPYSPHKSMDIARATEDRTGNFLIAYYLSQVLPRLSSANTEFVGISMSHFSQVIPGFTLAAMVKKHMPETRVVLGGTAIGSVCRFIDENCVLWPFFDALVIGAGEYTLERLLTNSWNEQSLPHLPNLLYRGQNGPVQTEIRYELNLEDVVTPEFTERRPRPIIPLSTSNGCDWAKCAFCHYPFSLSGDTPLLPSYTVRSIDKILDDLSILQKTYNPLCFQFTDANVPPARLHALADGILNLGLKVRYFSFMRAETAFSDLDFCRKLERSGFIGGLFGIESANPRTNRRMQKGIKIESVSQLLSNFESAGLIASVFCMIGFPGETPEEAHETIEFLMNNLPRIKGEVSLSNFHLKWNTPVFHHPSDFGITRIFHEDDIDLVNRYDYEVSGGLTQKASSMLVTKFYSQVGMGYFGNRLLYEVIAKHPWLK